MAQQKDLIGEEWLTIEEISSILRMTPYSTRRLVLEEGISYMRVGRNNLVSRNSLNEFLATRINVPKKNSGADRKKV